MVFIEGNMNTDSYIKLLEEAVPGSILKWKQKQGIPPRQMTSLKYSMVLEVCQAALSC